MQKIVNSENQQKHRKDLKTKKETNKKQEKPEKEIMTTKEKRKPSEKYKINKEY